MPPRTLVPIALLLAAGCTTTTTRTRTWTATSPAWSLQGRVERVTETVTEVQGDPAGGAAVGALVGGLIGGGLFDTGWDRWGPYRRGPSAAGALVGAIGGASVGAAASAGAPPSRSYEVEVRFDDGSFKAFTYGDRVPFQPGEAVSWDGSQLVRAQPPPRPPPPPPAG